MNQIYERDLDLNLLRVFVVVAEAGSVTSAAERLYLTQPAVSAALRRLSARVGEPLFARSGRGLTLTVRGKRLFAATRPHLSALVDAALAPLAFDPKTCADTVRIGLSDSNEAWLLPPLVRSLRSEAPELKLVILPIQFRTVADAFVEGRIDLAITVADELPAGVRRAPVFFGEFVCLFDPRHVALPKHPTIERYLAEEHVIVSYVGDLRGVVEDLLGLRRKVRLSVPTFAHVGAAVDGTGLVATVPDIIARDLMKTRPHLRTAEKPFRLSSTPMELLWRSDGEGEGAVSFVRQQIERIVAQIPTLKKSTPRRKSPKKN